MTTNTQRLRETARRVIDDFGDAWYDADDWTQPGDHTPPLVDAQHIVACAPCVITAILDELDALRAQVAALPADWRKDSSLETWFPLSAEELRTLRAENERLRKAIQGLLNSLPSSTTHPAIKAARAALQGKTHEQNTTP